MSLVFNDKIYGLENLVFLSDRERYVLIERCAHNKTLEEISRELNITRERVRQIMARAEMRLKRRVVKVKNYYGVENLNLSQRTYNCLKRAGIDTIPELRIMTDEELMTIKNLGRKSLKEVKEVLCEYADDLKPISKPQIIDDAIAYLCNEYGGDAKWLCLELIEIEDNLRKELI